MKSLRFGPYIFRENDFVEITGDPGKFTDKSKGNSIGRFGNVTFCDRRNETVRVWLPEFGASTYHASKLRCVDIAKGDVFYTNDVASDTQQTRFVNTQWELNSVNVNLLGGRVVAASPAKSTSQAVDVYVPTNQYRTCQISLELLRKGQEFNTTPTDYPATNIPEYKHSVTSSTPVDFNELFMGLSNEEASFVMDHMRSQVADILEVYRGMKNND